MKRALFSVALVTLGLLIVLTVSKAEVPMDRPQVGVRPSYTAGSGGYLGWKGPSIWDIIRSRQEFSDFQRAVDNAGLSNLLDTKGPFTVFVPTDSGFRQLPAQTEQQIMSNSKMSKEVVLNHTADGRMLYKVRTPMLGVLDLSRMGYIETSEGTRIPIQVTQGAIKVGQAKLIEANIGASNGVIHVVDQVNLPPELQEAVPQNQEGEGEHPQ